MYKVKWHWNCFWYEVGCLPSVMLQIFMGKQENKPTIKNNEDKGTRSVLCLNFGFIERLYLRCYFVAVKFWVWWVLPPRAKCLFLVGPFWVLILAISLERFVFSSLLAHCPPSVLFDNEHPCFQETFIIYTLFPFNALCVLVQASIVRPSF